MLSDGEETYSPSHAHASSLSSFTSFNLSVVNCSTSANYFHALRRQINRSFRKPLILISPKKLLKLKDAASPMSDFGETTSFQKVIGERQENLIFRPERISKLILCSGQVYYDVRKEREAQGVKDCVIVTLEQLAPFPFKEVMELCEKYENLKEVVWVQEEHRNMGAWTYV